MRFVKTLRQRRAKEAEQKALRQRRAKEAEQKPKGSRLRANSGDGSATTFPSITFTRVSKRTNRSEPMRRRGPQPAPLPLDALPDEVTKQRIRQVTKQRILREAEQVDNFLTKIAALGEELDELSEARQLLLFDLEPSRWPD